MAGMAGMAGMLVMGGMAGMGGMPGMVGMPGMAGMVITTIALPGMPVQGWKGGNIYPPVGGLSAPEVLRYNPDAEIGSVSRGH